MPAPERRARSDLAIAAVLAVAVLVVAGALWWTSDARRTTLITADGPVPSASAAQDAPVPASLSEAWRAPSPATPAPVVQGATVVTGAAGEVAGRNPENGSVRWSYRRDLPLCTVGPGAGKVVAVYQRADDCSEVSTLNWANGRRGPQRTGPVAAPTRLTSNGSEVAVTGRSYLEVWRSDLVRALAYGRLATPAQPGTQPRPDCQHGSMALNTGRLAVVEHCPGESSARLTVQRSHPKEPEEPEVDFSLLLPAKQARVVAMNPTRVAVALSDPARLLVLDGVGKSVAVHPLKVPAAELQGDPAGGLTTITETPTGIYWYTGSATVALDATTLRPRWTHTGALGPGSVAGRQLLLPVPGALAVLDITTGNQIRSIPVDRGDYRGPVGTGYADGMVFEQRGQALVALH
jgi:hypothetical protein